MGAGLGSTSRPTTPGRLQAQPPRPLTQGLRDPPRDHLAACVGSAPLQWRYERQD